ncbi:Fic family protein [bacterium]|nr:Fic family protein [bacterium]
MDYIWQHKDWPAFRWHDREILKVLGEVRFKQGAFLKRVSQLGFKLMLESSAKILFQETMTTSGIEGHNLNPEAVRSSIAKRLGLPDQRKIVVDRSAEGLIDVLLEATGHFQQPLTEKRLQGWQAALFPSGFSSYRKVKVSDWRGPEVMQVVSGPFSREKVHYEAPPQERLKREIKTFIKWFEKESKSLDGIIQAGLAHFYFVTIHPFEDGNGRIARALTDMALARDEQLPTRYYSLSARILKERKNYYAVLEKEQKSGLDITGWLSWFLGCFSRAIDDSEKIISDVLIKADFWARHGQTTLNERQKKVINNLLDSDQTAPQLTTKKYGAVTRVSRATAFREIDDLLKKSVIVQNNAKGRSVSYRLNLK